jgi:hypothetical protein
MLELEASALLPEVIPPTAELRMRLAQLLTEADLVKAMIRLSVRREREAARLARVADMLKGGGRVA